MKCSSHFMVGYVGLGYLAIGIMLTFNLESHIQNINMSILPSFLGSITLASALFGFAECLHLFLVEKNTIKNLKSIEIDKITSELNLYQKINIAMNVKSKFFRSAADFVYCSAFAFSIILVLYRPILELNTQGMSLIAFGFFITCYGYRATLKETQQAIIDGLLFEYCKQTQREER